jgi:predicted acetyltransferase
VGYEQAGTWTRYRVPISGFRVRDRELAVERVRWEDLDHIRQVYDTRARREAGNLDRSDWAWRRIFEPMRGKTYVFRACRGKKTEGYIAFARKWHADHLHGHDLHCLDFVALTPEAGRRLLTLVADHRSLGRDLLVIGPPSAPALLPLAEQIATVDMLLRWMVRIIWVKAALEARGYPRHLRAELALEIHDDQLPANTGGYSLRIDSGVGRVERRRVGKGLWLHVRGLAALYTGYNTAEQLEAIGLARGDADTLALATEMFAGPTPWLAEMF